MPNKRVVVDLLLVNHCKYILYHFRVSLFDVK